ncbi:MAG: tetratricopeptide repeat protein, partial [Deltaproteobacteria bacterium]|nr:tetratricopeptide repeat protein [Deltaproteobacteria bacterium]
MFLLVAAALFTRSPASNYIFDEQEALLANPYVNGRVPFTDLFSRDFWGLPPGGTIGSYRPVPNLVWRGFWALGGPLRTPWALHWVNLVLHALNAALVATVAVHLGAARRAAWVSGLVFCSFAVLTEAVTGVVGLADVASALGVLLALRALELPLVAAGPAVLAAVAVGLFAKEAALVAVPLVPWVALVAARRHHPGRPLPVARALVALVSAALALVLYTETRRRCFPTELPASLRAALPPDASPPEHALRAFLRWFAQPRLPQDPINNPLVRADLAGRVAGGLSVFAGGLGQLLVPVTLSGDYSFAAEPIPAHALSPRSVAGGLSMVGLPLLGMGAALAARRAGPAVTLLSIGLVWVPVAYFPHSNLPALLPTVRADRFWYLPAVGAALALGPLLAAGLGVAGRARRPACVLVATFLLFQAGSARWHALDYRDDLSFWRATARAVPASAKAHLNHGIMLGTRGDLAGRIAENRRAVELAPDWPMANVYLGDALCRQGRSDESIPHYLRGFALGPNEKSLVALGLQCLWEKGLFEAHRGELEDLAVASPGTWVSYLVHDVAEHGAEHGGVDR